MYLPDTSVWIAVALSSHGLHASAGNWIAAQSARNSILFCRATQQSFLRLLTTQSVMQLYGLPPFNNAGAWQLMEAFLSDARIDFVAEPPNLAVHWKKLASRNTPSPKLWMDAYLAAFAVAGRHRLITADRAFLQVKNLDVLILS